MCGIAGIWSNEIDPETIKLMTDTLIHRGPDAYGTYINENRTLALGHTRLSVIDLSMNARQPMSTPDGRFIIVFNGEIYNFKNIRKEILLADPSITFSTQSDTETILYAFKLWQDEMVVKLEGMFALAIFDSLKNKIFLTRDRVGKKPLYYYLADQHFIFASELKALLKHPLVARDKNLNRKAINYFLHLGYIPEPFTIYSSVKKFPFRRDSGSRFRLRRTSGLSGLHGQCFENFWCRGAAHLRVPLRWAGILTNGRLAPRGAWGQDRTADARIFSPSLYH